MTGTDDVLVPPQNSEILAGRIPKSELVQIKACGHGFLKQKTEEAIEYTLNFLDKVQREIYKTNQVNSPQVS